MNTIQSEEYYTCSEMARLTAIGLRSEESSASSLAEDEILLSARNDVMDGLQKQSISV